MSASTVRPAGDRALLVDPGDPARLAIVVDGLVRRPPAGVEDLVPAARTVLVTLTATANRSSITAELLRRCESACSGGPGTRTSAPIEVVTIPVRYDGADLDAVADLLGQTVDEVIAAHTSRRWRCAFLGFAPGFGYLEADRPGLSVPRRDRARTAIPAGAVALAGGYSAVYPRRSPGGWQLIGTTDAPMWDLDRPEPSLLRPGTVVRFVDRDRP